MAKAGGATATKQTKETEAVARRYFEAVGERDPDAMVACWAPGGINHVAPLGDLTAPDDVRALFTELFAALPDSSFEILRIVATGDHAACHWRLSGTFSGAPFQGIEPTNQSLSLEGIDMVRVEDGLIGRNDAHYDGMEFARQIGLMPERDGAAERTMRTAFNARTKVAQKLLGARTESVAEGVWVVRGGFPKRSMNVYLIQDGDQVTVFDAGIADMARDVAAEAAARGGIKQIVLGHSHADHRGSASALGAPVLCHPDEAADAEGDGGEHYFDYAKVQRSIVRWAFPKVLAHWDGGPVKVADTLSEGDEVAGFEVVHLPGHAPGLIGLFRKSDRLALVSDCFYTVDPESGAYGPPRVPHPAFTPKREQARESIRKLAALEPAAAWPGHAEPVTGDVRSQLEHAASTT